MVPVVAGSNPVIHPFSLYSKLDLFFYNQVSSFSHFLNQNNHRIFLIDGLGALTTSLFLLTFAQFAPFLGIPSNYLYSLSLYAILLSCYSLTSFLKQPRNWKRLLRLLVYLNILYCCISLSVGLYFINTITVYGIVYFLSEKCIVLGLAWIEWQRSA